MTTYRFAPSALLADSGRAAAGVALTLGPLILLETAPVVSWVFAALAALFLWFGLRTAVRHWSRIEVSDTQIALAGPRSRILRWQDLDDVRLAYFAARRGRERHQPGWLQLTLYGTRGARLRVDSTLDGFDQVLAAVHRAVQARDLPLDPITAANFAALGLGADATSPQARAPEREALLR